MLFDLFYLFIYLFFYILIELIVCAGDG